MKSWGERSPFSEPVRAGDLVTDTFWRAFNQPADDRCAFSIDAFECPEFEVFVVDEKLAHPLKPRGPGRSLLEWTIFSGWPGN